MGSGRTRHEVKRTTRWTIIAIAWLVIAPLFVLAPTGRETAAGDAGSQPAVEPVFGERLSAPGDSGYSRDAEAMTDAHAANIRAAKRRAHFPPPPGFLPEPEWQIWPDDDQNQVVNLESFLRVTDGWERRTLVISFWFYTMAWQSFPIASVWEFEETETGNTDREFCPNPGAPWFPGATNPLCGHDWEHSSDVTGDVEADMFILHWVHFSDSNGANYSFPFPSPTADSEMLEVAEVLTYGRSTEAPVAYSPGGGGDDGWCSTFGIKFICWIGEEVGERALATLLRFAPWLREIANFFEGCGQAFMDEIGGIVGLLTTIKDAVSDPRKFIDEQFKMIKDLYEAATADPAAFALEFGEEFLRDVLELDTLENDGTAQWAGKVICKLAIQYLTGKAAATLVTKIDDFLKRRRNGPDGPDVPCRISSFPGDTEVRMADGSLERIDRIEPGDWVLSHNLDTSVWEPKQVLDQWSHLDRGPPATAALLDGSQVTATDDHFFWVTPTGAPGVSGNGRWTELAAVAPGDRLLSPAGPVTVEVVTVGTSQTWTVWELTVADNHNFTVHTGTVDLLAHNKCGDPNTPPPPGYSGRPLSTLLTNGKIPGSADFARWWDDLSSEELAYLIRAGYKSDIGDGIRFPGGSHEWCMCSQMQKFKDWGVSMAQIKGFSTSTALTRGTTAPLRGPNGQPYPSDWAGRPWSHPSSGVDNSSASRAFHNELSQMIDNSATLRDFQNNLPGLLNRWGVDPSVVPPFPTP